MGGKNTKAQFAATVVNDRSYGYEHRYDVPLFDDVAPLPTLTPELSRWLARSSARNERVWAVEYGDAKFAESIGEVIALAARFTVVGWLDGELRQFTRFTNDQMLRALGWTDKDRVRRALHAACFQMTRRDGEKGAMMCEVLRERGEKPFLELIKQGVKGQASSYRLVGIEPQARAANCPSAGNGAGTAGAVEPAPTCYARRGPGDEGAPPESPVSGPDSTGQAPPCPPADVPETLSRQSAGECFGERVETGAFQLPVGQPAVPGGAPAPQPAPASQPACSPRPAAAPQPAPAAPAPAQPAPKPGPRVENARRMEEQSEAAKKRSTMDVFASMMSEVSGQDVRVVKRVSGPNGAPVTIGRNDPCPCGSGKKYKKCCGRDQF